MGCKYKILSDNLFGDKSPLSVVIDKEKLSQIWSATELS